MNASLPPTSSATANSVTSPKRLSNSVFVWLVLVAYMVIVKIVLDTFLPHAFADPGQAALFGWVPLGIFSVLGLIGVLLAERTGFPDAWDKRVSVRQRILLPLLIGVAFGVLQVAIDLLTGFSQLIAARHGLTQQFTDFPSMFLIFTAAPIIVEVVYRLFLVPLVLWLVSNLLLKGKAQASLFWVLAILTSALEPLTQFPDLQILPAGLAVLLGLEYFVVNLTQAAFFRKRGFLAAILVRVGFYLVWHLMYIH